MGILEAADVEQALRLFESTNAVPDDTPASPIPKSNQSSCIPGVRCRAGGGLTFPG